MVAAPDTLIATGFNFQQTPAKNIYITPDGGSQTNLQRAFPVILTAAQIASPTAAMLADLSATYRLNVAPYTRYYSDGTGLVAGGTFSNQYGSIGPSLETPSASMLSAFYMTTNTSRYFDNFALIKNPSKSYWQQNITATFAAGDTHVTAVSSTSGALVGNYLQEQTDASGALVNPIGTTFPAGTYIASGITASGFTMSANALVSGTKTFSIVSASGNAADVYGTQNNGQLGDGQVYFAVGTSSPGTDGFYTNRSVGAAGNTNLFGMGYLETSSLGPASNLQYLHTGFVITHNANTDWLPSKSWRPFWINGQTGDMQWLNSSTGVMMSLGEASGTLFLGGQMTIQQPAVNTNILYMQNSDATRAFTFATDGSRFPGFAMYKDTILYAAFEGFYSSSMKPSDYANSGGLEIGGTAVTNASHGYGIKITNPSANGAAGFNGNVVMLGGYLSTKPATGLTAAGTTRADALALTSQFNNLTTAAASTGVVLPSAATVGVGGWVDVFNGGANPAQVYAAGSDTIDGTAGATGVPLTNAKRCRYSVTAALTFISAQWGVPSA